MRTFRAMNNRGQFLKGAGTTILVVLAMTYALYGFAIMGFASVWWTVLFFTVIFACTLAAPRAFRLMKEGLSGLDDAGPGRQSLRAGRGTGSAPNVPPPGEKSAELRVLEAIEGKGKLTPAQAAIQTGLSVVETDRLLSGLAQKGHLEVHAEGGKLFYGL